MAKQISGARESNVGDDFHLVWAAKKALALLEPNTNFKALCVEGPSLIDAKDFDVDSNDLLSIDIAEYYGAMTFEEAVVTVPKELPKRFVEEFAIEDSYRPQELSVQVLADSINPYGGYREYSNGKLWLGCPLVIHRRCILITQKAKLKEISL